MPPEAAVPAESTSSASAPTSRPRPRRTVGLLLAAATVGLGALHFGVDGLTGLLVPLQPALAARTQTAVELWTLVVAVAFASASLLQPATAHLAARWGDARTAVVGAVIAVAGYGLLPAAPTLGHALAAVVAGGLGSALFHPAAGALVARTAPRGKESLPLAMFSAVGTAGAALVPVAVVVSLDRLGSAAAAPAGIAVLLVAAAVTILLARSHRRPFSPPGRTHPVTAKNPYLGTTVVTGVRSLCWPAPPSTPLRRCSSPQISAPLTRCWAGRPPATVRPAPSAVYCLPCGRGAAGSASSCSWPSPPERSPGWRFRTYPRSLRQCWPFPPARAFPDLCRCWSPSPDDPAKPPPPSPPSRGCSGSGPR